MEALSSPKQIEHMETMILAEMEPGSFSWWFVRDTWSVVWAICAIATLNFIVRKITDAGNWWSDDDKVELGLGFGAGVITCVIWPLIFSGCSGCGPWLDDGERDDLTHALRAKMEQIVAEENAVAARIRARIDATRKAKNKEVVMQHLCFFSTSEGARITQIIKQLKAAEEGLREKIIGLKEVLVGVGNDPEKDQEYLSWGGMLQRLIRDRRDLERKLEDAFLASERFRLAPSDVFKAEMTGHISKGNELANEFAGRYRALMQTK